jgi:sorbitol-specific phosphotransferase system component IIA
MNETGEDIKEVYQEIGTPFLLYKFGSTDPLEEKGMTERYTEQSTEFIRQYVIVLNVWYDSNVEPGDLIDLQEKNYIITSKDPTNVEGMPAFYRAMAYRCNEVVNVLSKNDGLGYDAEYNPVAPYTKKEEVPCLLVDNKRETEAGEEDEVYYASGSSFTCYIQAYDVKAGDRIRIKNKDYLVENIHTHRLKDVLILYLKPLQDLAEV